MFPDTLVPHEPPLHRACLALVIVVLLFVGSAELVVLNAPAGRADTAGRASVVAGGDRLTVDRRLPPRHRGGRTLVRLDDASLLAVRRDVSDTSLLQVIVPHGRGVLDCNLIAAHVTVLRQDATQVRLRVSGYEYEPAASARARTGGTTCVAAGTASVPVRLSAPLAGRPVYLGQARQAVPVDSRRASVP